MSQFQEPPAGPSAQTWEQDVVVGGEDVNSNPAPLAVATAPQGIATVRDVPTVAAAANSRAFLASAEPFRLVGKTLQRRHITIITTAAGLLNVSMSMSQGQVGLPIPPNVPIPLSSASEIWFAPGAGAGVIGFWAEIDQG